MSILVDVVANAVSIIFVDMTVDAVSLTANVVASTVSPFVDVVAHTVALFGDVI